MGRAVVAGVALGILALVILFYPRQDPAPPPIIWEIDVEALQRQNAALRDSLAAERGWDTTPPGFIREICEVQDE